MKTFIIALAAAALCVALMMAGLGIKMLCRRSRMFRRPCANADPATGRCAHCTCQHTESDTATRDNKVKKHCYEH